MVDDPSSHPELFPTEESQDEERRRLFQIIKDLMDWKNTRNEDILQSARSEILKSWQYTCEDNKDHPKRSDLFNPARLPAFHDPFAGGGALPTEAQRLGMDSYASDINPVAALINRAMIEIPSNFIDRPPINPAAEISPSLIETNWKGFNGLAEDIQYYGEWMRAEAMRRVGHLYPKYEISTDIIQDRPDLQKYKGQELTVVAWLWARTVKSPDPAFGSSEVPLVSSFTLAEKNGESTYIEPIINETERDVK